MSDEKPETPDTPLSDGVEGVDPQTESPVSASEHVSLDSTAESSPPELVVPESDGADLNSAELGDAGVVDPKPVLVDEPHAIESPAAEPLPEPAVAAEPRAVQTVYVRAPEPPARKGNRGIGSLIALASAVIFAAIYAGVVLAVSPLFAPPRAIGFEFLSFVSSAAFFVPVAVFAVVFIVLVLIVNRAGWWAHVIGSLFVGILVYVLSIGILLLLNNVIGMTPSAAARSLRSAMGSPLIITAGLVAREVSLWMGAAIAARGRRVKAKNAESRAKFDSDSARARAEYESAVAANATI